MTLFGINFSVLQLWLLLAAVMILAEITILTFNSICFAGGAAVSALIAAFGGGLGLQIILFFVISLLILKFGKPAYIKKRGLKEGTSNYVGGMMGTAIKRINLKHYGKVQVGENIYPALVRENYEIEVGDNVRITEIKALKAVVVPVDK